MLKTDPHELYQLDLFWFAVQWPSWEIWVRQWEGWHPIYKNKFHVPNHQPGITHNRFNNRINDIPYMKWKIKNLWNHQPALNQSIEPGKMGPGKSAHLHPAIHGAKIPPWFQYSQEPCQLELAPCRFSLWLVFLQAKNKAVLHFKFVRKHIMKPSRVGHM